MIAAGLVTQSLRNPTTATLPVPPQVARVNGLVEEI
jgi:hypothetical protein